MSSRDKIEAGSTTTADSTTELVGARLDAKKFLARVKRDFMGDVILRVASASDDLKPRHRVDAIQGVAAGGDGVAGVSDSKDRSGVYGFNSYGGEERGGAYGVYGRCQALDGAGVAGNNDRGDAVCGTSHAGQGIHGSSVEGVGVKGESRNNDAVVGISDSAGKSGVYGFNSTLALEAAFGVFGRCNAANGAGVSGCNDAENGDAVSGFSPNGYGGHFTGGRAPLRLHPAVTVGAPTTGTHQNGELFVDRNGDLFYCKIGGSPGTWFRVALTPA